jgi:hypothetical protein
MAPDDPAWLKVLASFLVVAVGQGIARLRRSIRSTPDPRDESAGERAEIPHSVGYRLGAAWARRRQQRRQALANRRIGARSEAGTHSCRS